MSTNLLHYEYQTASQQPAKGTLVFIHGLFGDRNNLGAVARAFAEEYNLLRVDLRNHGLSFFSEEMNYALMAADVDRVLQALEINEVTLIGHSMGGKTAMAFAGAFAAKVKKLVVIDIAPVQNPLNRHDRVFEALFAVKKAAPQTRQQAREVVQSFNLDAATEAFMLKSFDATAPDLFRFNLSALKVNYPNIMGWERVFADVPTLFIRGGESDYIKDSDREAILAQFPQAQAFTVQGANHWVHASHPDAVIRVIQRFLTQK